MADQDTQEEPTMEEILASIRRIISEDEENGEGESEVADVAEPPIGDDAEGEELDQSAVDNLFDDIPMPAADPEPEPEPESVPEVAAEPEPVEDIDDDDLMVEDAVPEPDPIPEPEPEPVAAAPIPTPMPDPVPEPPMQTAQVIELTQMVDIPTPTGNLISDNTAVEAASAFAGLAGAFTTRNDIPVPQNRTLEDITKELLRPMLKEWLDANLPTIVQRIVEREVSKLTGNVDQMMR